MMMCLFTLVEIEVTINYFIFGQTKEAPFDYIQSARDVRQSVRQFIDNVFIFQAMNLPETKCRRCLQMLIVL